MRLGVTWAQSYKQNLPRKFIRRYFGADNQNA